MPINAGPEYFASLDKAQEASDPKEKLRWLLEAYKLVPKHKGTENERKMLMQRIAKLRRGLEQQKKQSGRSSEDTIRKEGEFQIVLFGYPNTFKSTILKYFTDKDVKIDIYPFTTYEPEVGAIDYKSAKIQMVELPGFKEDYEGRYYSILRNTDIIALTALDEKQLKDLINYLEDKKIVFKEEKNYKIKIKRKTGKFEILGLHNIDISKEEIIEILQSYGYRGCEMTILEKCTFEDLIDVLERKEPKKGIIFTPLKIEEHKGLKVFKLSGDKEKDKKRLIESCGYIEVYLKPLKKEVSKIPLIVEKGTTAIEIYTKFFEGKPKQIRLRNNGKMINISYDYVLNDMDILEFIV